MLKIQLGITEINDILNCIKMENIYFLAVYMQKIKMFRINSFPIWSIGFPLYVISILTSFVH